MSYSCSAVCMRYSRKPSHCRLRKTYLNPLRMFLNHCLPVNRALVTREMDHESWIVKRSSLSRRPFADPITTNDPNCLSLSSAEIVPVLLQVLQLDTTALAPILNPTNILTGTKRLLPHLSPPMTAKPQSTALALKRWKKNTPPISKFQLLSPEILLAILRHIENPLDLIRLMEVNKGLYKLLTGRRGTQLWAASLGKIRGNFKHLSTILPPLVDSKTRSWALWSFARILFDNMCHGCRNRGKDCQIDFRIRLRLCTACYEERRSYGIEAECGNDPSLLYSPLLKAWALYSQGYQATYRARAAKWKKSELFALHHPIVDRERLKCIQRIRQKKLQEFGGSCVRLREWEEAVVGRLEMPQYISTVTEWYLANMQDCKGYIATRHRINEMAGIKDPVELDERLVQRSRKAPVRSRF